MEIIYKSKDYVIVNKDYGMLSEYHPTQQNVPASLAEELGIPLERIYTVHRLDRTTAGLMVYALSKRGASELSRAIQDGNFRKIYTAHITADESLAPSGEMRDHLYFDRRKDKSFVVKGDRKGAKEAVLTYEIVDTYEYKGAVVSVAKVELQTGRTHQIRVQFGSRKSPLLGDGKYGSRVNFKGASLFSTELEFLWGGETVRYIIEKGDIK